MPTGSKTRPPTMADVARLAGVSQATVSYVLGGRAEARRIPSATVDRIRRVCQRLDYRRDYLATALATKKTGVVGVVFANAMGEFIDRMLRGIQQELRKHNRQIALCLCEDDATIEEKAIESLRFRHVDGIIAFPVWDRDTSRVWDHLLASEKPVVFVDSLPSGIDSQSIVAIDDRKVGRDAASILVRHGAGRLALVGRDAGEVAQTVRLRQEGFLEGAEAAGLGQPLLVDADDVAGITRLLDGTEGPVGVFSARTHAITRPLMEMFSLGNEADPSVTIASCGLDREPFLVRNPWWMAEQPVFEMGRSAAALLLAALEGAPVAPRPVILDVQWRRNRLVRGQDEPREG